MPERFKEALDGNKVAKAVFESMSPSRQKEILTYLNWLKTPEALERNVKKVIAILLRRKDGAGG